MSSADFHTSHCILLCCSNGLIKVKGCFTNHKLVYITNFNTHQQSSSRPILRLSRPISFIVMMLPSEMYLINTFLFFSTQASTAEDAKRQRVTITSRGGFS